MTREQSIREYGLALVEANEQYWQEQSYTIDYAKDRLVQIK